MGGKKAKAKKKDLQSILSLWAKVEACALFVLLYVHH